MPDVFISYTSTDETLARFVHDHLKTDGVSVFLASASLGHGDQWSPAVLDNLRQAEWVIFLASKRACMSPYVQQELGMALGANKKIVPVIWEVQPGELPGWASKYQALDLRGKSIEAFKSDMSAIASKIKSNKLLGLAILGSLVAAVLKFG